MEKDMVETIKILHSIATKFYVVEVTKFYILHGLTMAKSLSLWVLYQVFTSITFEEKNAIRYYQLKSSEVK